MTDLRPNCTQIIGHNSVNVHRIPTKVGTEICLNELFKCAKCQPYWSMHSCVVADFAKCAKRREEKVEEEKKRGKNSNFGHSYLGNGLSDFLQSWNVDSLT